MKIAIIVFVALFTLGFVAASMWISTSNAEVELRARLEAQQRNLENVHDRMWKILSQQAGVSNEYKKSFAEIYPQLIEGRYSKGDGSLMKWIQESNPAFDTSLYKTVSQSIEAQRESFAREQKLLLDLKREHDSLLMKFPGSIILAGRPKIEVKLITSTRSKEALETGVDNDTKLFE